MLGIKMRCGICSSKRFDVNRNIREDEEVSVMELECLGCNEEYEIELNNDLDVWYYD